MSRCASRQTMVLGKTFTVLLADDDEDYAYLVKQAFEEACPNYQMFRVEDGVELLDYLRSEGKYKGSIRPHVILLDLNMPRKNGREALHEMKLDPSLKQIPVVIFSTSKSEKDVTELYELGAHSYIWKPLGFKQIVDMLKVFCQYWSQSIELIQQGRSS